MPTFDVKQPLWVTADYAVQRIQDAWVMQVEGRSLISQWIRLASQGVHTHSAMFARTEDGVDVLEVREFHGGRRKPLDYHLRQEGRFDCFSPCAHGLFKDRFRPHEAVSLMRKLTECDYGYRGILQMLLRRTPFIWRMYPEITIDTLPDDAPQMRQPFCSQAVCMACQYGGGVDPVPRCPNFLVSPGMLTTSMFFDYEFSIVTPWAMKHYSASIMEVARLNEALLTTKEQVKR